MTNHKPIRQTPQLFKRFPAVNREGLIVHHKARGDEEFAMYFREAGERLADTFSGQPSDDLLLMPWLFLMRHAVELSLKNTIRFAGALRRRSGHPTDPAYPFGVEEVGARLLRTHQIGVLVEEADHHLAALELETIPADVRKTLQQLSDVDPRGTAFRYFDSKRSPNSGGTNIDFPSLRAEIERAHLISACALDMLEAFASALTDSQEAQRTFEEELAAEFEPTLNDYY